MQGINTAAGIVLYSSGKPMFRDVSHKRFLSATTTRRVFSHVTKADVETPENIELFKNRSVFTLDGKYYVYYILR